MIDKDYRKRARPFQRPPPPPPPPTATTRPVQSHQKGYAQPRPSPPPPPPTTTRPVQSHQKGYAQPRSPPSTEAPSPGLGGPPGVKGYSPPSRENRMPQFRHYGGLQQRHQSSYRHRTRKNINIQSDQPRPRQRPRVPGSGLARMTERRRGRAVFSLPTVRRFSSEEQHQVGPEEVRLSDTFSGPA